jgi:hypothetical protein
LRKEIRLRHFHGGAGLIEIGDGDGNLLVVRRGQGFQTVEFRVGVNVPPRAAWKLRRRLGGFPFTGVGDGR